MNDMNNDTDVAGVLMFGIIALIMFSTAGASAAFALDFDPIKGMAAGASITLALLGAVFVMVLTRGVWNDLQ